MTDFDGFMKQIKGSQKKDDDDDGSDLEDELDALDREVNQKPKGKKGSKKKKKDDDGDLNLSDLSEDEDKGDEPLSNDDGESKEQAKKPQAKPQPQPQQQSQPQPQATKTTSQPQPKPQSQPKQQPQEQPKPTVIDIYGEYTEKNYHNVDNMKSMSVFEAEKEICDKIIKFKKDNGFDNYDLWEAKKNIIDANSNKIQNMIENNILDLEGYKKLLTTELNYYLKLLDYMKKDTKLQKDEIEEVTNRIKERMKLIEAELSESVEQEDVQEEEQQQQAPNPEQCQKETDNEKEETNEDTKEKGKDEVEAKVNEKPKKINEKLIQELNQRVEEYKGAYQYFKEHYLEEQMNTSLKDIKEIILAIKALEAGKDKEIDEFLLPPGVTPEYIVGCPSKERIQHYKDFITELSAQKSEITKSLKALSEKLKSMSKSDLKKIQDFAKKDIEAKKAKIDKYDKIIKMLLENAKNPWIPAPQFSKVTEEEKIEKINEKIPEFNVVIHFGLSEYKDSKQYLNVIIVIADKEKSEYVYPKTKQLFNDDLNWQFEKNEYKHLFRKEIEIQVISKGFLSSKKVGGAKLKLTDLRDKCEKKFVLDIDMEDKKKFPTAPKMEITIMLRTPFAEKEYDIKTKEVFTVTKIYPPFKGEGFNHSTLIDHKTVPHNAPINKVKSQGNPELTMSTKSNPSSHSIQSAQPQSQSQSQSKSQVITSKGKAGTIEQISNKPKVSKSQFSSEELDNPDHIDNLNSVEVLTLKEKEIDERIKQIEGRTPKPIRDQLLKVRCKKRVLEEQLGEGAITPSGYMEIIKKQYQHDKMLYDYFEQENMKDKASIVAVRLKLLLKETNELIEFLKKNPG